jgi:hypothetical protein
LAISLPASHCEIEENRPFAANPILSGARELPLRWGLRLVLTDSKL